jgi:hypothetical protein
MTLGEFLHGMSVISCCYLFKHEFKGLSCAFEILRDDVGSEGKRHVTKYATRIPPPQNQPSEKDLCSHIIEIWLCDIDGLLEDIVDEHTFPRLRV